MAPDDRGAGKYDMLPELNVGKVWAGLLLMLSMF
jgi:hypothetical protein